MPRIFGLLYYTHLHSRWGADEIQRVIMAAGSWWSQWVIMAGLKSLLLVLMKVTVWHFVSDSYSLWLHSLLLSSATSVAVEISLQTCRDLHFHLVFLHVLSGLQWLGWVPKFRKLKIVITLQGMVLMKSNTKIMTFCIHICVDCSRFV